MLEMDSSTDEMGYCSRCGIFRQDTATGVPVTDCVCTVSKQHAVDCQYRKTVACPIDVGSHCEKHGLFACEECDCTCDVGLT